MELKELRFFKKYLCKFLSFSCCFLLYSAANSFNFWSELFIPVCFNKLFKLNFGFKSFSISVLDRGDNKVDNVFSFISGIILTFETEVHKLNQYL
jgi:hypothetical protein